MGAEAHPDISSLTGHPTTFARPPLLALVRASTDRTRPLADLIDPIEHDPALTALYCEFSCRDEPLSLERWDAGLAPATARVMALSCGQALAAWGRGAELERLIDGWWREGLAQACLNRALAVVLHYASPRQAWITGMLTGIGRHLLLGSHGERYLALLNDPARSDEELLAREQREFGTDHATLGAALLESWRADPEAASALLHHHLDPARLLDADVLVRMSAVARALSPSLIGGSEDAPGSEQSALAERLLDLDKGATGAAYLSARARYRELTAAYAQEGSGVASVEGVVAPDALRAEVDRAGVVGAVHAALAECEQIASWWMCVTQLVRVLFGLRGCQLFELDESSRQLVASELSPAIGRFAIRMESGRSLLTESLATGEPCYGISDTLEAVVDRELCRVTGAPGLAVMPLVAADGTTALLVAGWMPADANARDPNTGAGEERTLLQELFCRLAGIRLGELQSGSAIQGAAPNLIDRNRLKERTREITHEINNPLAIVQNYLKILSLKLGDDHQAQHNLSVIQEEIERIGAIVGKFSDLDAESLLPESPSSLNSAVRDIAEIVRESTPGVEIDLALGSIRGWNGHHRDRLKQILLNLLKNSVEAGDGAARVRIATRGEVSQEGRMYIELTLTDDGPGIPDAIRQRLFEPVESAKGEGHQGIGLAIVRGLVDEMGGVISCQSESDGGTEFRILIPQLRLDN